jgi:hypothetical protein
MAIDPFCKSCIKTDLTSLHYVTFMEPLAIFPIEALPFDSKQFTNNSINKVVESKTEESFLLLEEHIFAAISLYKNLMKFNSETYHMKFLSYSHKCKYSSKIFVHNKVYYNKLIVLIFASLPF